jgi:8-oxo-dGTP diphosphatase
MSKVHNGNNGAWEKHQREASRYFRDISKTCIHYLSIDCVVFGFHENRLKVLLLKWKGTDQWSLPGGFIRKNESVEDAAQRCLRERTGLPKTFLRHFNNFGDVRRYDQGKTWKKINLDLPVTNWSERTISIGYFALVEHSKVKPSPDFLTEVCEWVDVTDIFTLLFDHNKIVSSALEALRRELPYLPINHLLADTFTLPDLQRLYETILGRKLDTRNFQRKILSTGILERLEKKMEGTPYKSPYLYRFVTRKYSEALKEGTLAFL